jgi:nucleoside-diphosphate-sugar epimerase
MKTFALTGATGLLGSNLLLEILKRNMGDLARTRVLVLGRDGTTDLGQRLTGFIRRRGWQYLMDAYDDALVQAACAAITPVPVDLSAGRAQVAPEAFAALSARPIDYFFHVAGLTDFRSHDHVVTRLVATNVGGTQNVLDLLDALPRRVGKLGFVSSAYVCGKTWGAISPDYVILDQEFRNPYERTKLEAEIKVRSYCRDRGLACDIYRPSTLAGRILERPAGHVTKCDVYLGWLYFFMRLKSKLLNSDAWSDIESTPVDIPVRVACNQDVGLNIVASDLCAKILYAAMTEGRNTPSAATSYHVVSQRDLPVGVLIPHMLSRGNVTGYSLVRDRPRALETRFERMYYSCVGEVYTPYVIHPAAMEFEQAATAELCDRQGIAALAIDRKERLDLMLNYAFSRQFDMAE